MEANKDVKVSIVIPVYNVESYLSDCLNSVTQQTLNEIEIICVNDASTDESLKIIEGYAAKDPRIIVISQKVNRGLSVSRNVGANCAKGEYLYFLDSDDMISLNAMQELYDKAKKENLDVLCFEGDTFFENKELEKRCSWCKSWCVRSREYSGVKTGIQLMTEMYDKSDYKALVWILFIKREFYVNENLNFVPGLIFEDNPFTFECMVKANRASHVWKKYYIRRVREESVTTTNKCDIKYPYGFFFSGLYIMSIVENLKVNLQDTFVVGKEVERMFVQAQGQLNKIDEIEIQKYKDFNPYEKVLFEQFVLKPYNAQKLNKNLQTQIKNKEDLLNDKKSEIEQLRVRVNDETKEKDIALKNVKKLSENLKNKENELKKYKTELDNVKTGMSFRIGRVITYIPRKIMGKK